MNHFIGTFECKADNKGRVMIPVSLKKQLTLGVKDDFVIKRAVFNTCLELYPMSEIVGKANILIMPALHSAAISTKLMKEYGGAKLIGPLLIGLGLPIEVAPLRSSTSDILNLASVAAYSSDVIDYSN